MKPSGKTWSLTVRAGWLHLDAPHGSFPVRGVAPDVVPVVRALPDGTDVECEGAFDGGGTISNLHVTKVRRILKDLSGRVMSLPDVIVRADGRLAAARARIHLEAGRVDAAAADIGALLRLGDEQAIGEYERLPAEHQAPLFEELVAWQAQRPATWRALRHIPLARWTDANVQQAVEQALASGGVFGAAPGIPAEPLLVELARRERPTAELAKQTQRLRRAQATEGDTFYRLVTEIASPRVIGADHAGVYVRGTLDFGTVVEQRGAQRRQHEDRRSVVVHQALDGAELRRWIGIAPDRVVEGVALYMEADEPTGVRLADGKPLFAFAHRIEHHDGELLWGIHARDAATRTMRSEIVHVATGWSIARFDHWVDDVEWNAQHIFVRGPHPQTLARDGKIVADSVPPPPATLDIENATGRHTIPALHAPWRFGEWNTVDAGGWIVHRQQRRLYLAPAEPGASWVALELVRDAPHVDLAPPWLAIHQTDGPIVLLALAEAMSALEVRIDGKRFVRRAKADPRLAVPPAIAAWYEALVAAGVTPPRSAEERDAHLNRVLDLAKPLPTDALARVLRDHSPWCLEHADFYVEDDDPIFERLTAILADANVAVREVARTTDEDDDSDDDDDDTSTTLTIEATRASRRSKRQCPWGIPHVMAAVDAMLGQLGSPRRIYALTCHDWNRRVYLVITPEQRRALAAANVTGIHAGPRA